MTRINILINEPDKYYLAGMTSIFRNVFESQYFQEVNFFHDMSELCIWNADIIVIPLFKGEELTCKKEFRYRSKGIVIGLSRSSSRSRHRKPLCYRDMVMVPRGSSVEGMSSAIVQAWNQRRREALYPPDYSCQDCCRICLSPREQAIAAEIMANTSTSKIASKLKISEKTVYAHKYLIMKKFNMSGNKEFATFLQHLRRNESTQEG